MKTNPVYKRECMVSARSFRLALVLLVFNGILALVALLNMYSALAQVRLTAEVQYTGFLDLYMFVASLEFLMLILIMPALTAGSISGERERQTLDLMLTTCMTPADIVLGKLEAALGTMSLMVVSSLPILAMVFVYGGVAASDLILLVSVLFCPVSPDYSGHGSGLCGNGGADSRNLRYQLPGNLYQPDADRGISGIGGSRRGIRRIRKPAVYAAAEPHCHLQPGYRTADRQQSELGTGGNLVRQRGRQPPYRPVDGREHGAADDAGHCACAVDGPAVKLQKMQLYGSVFTIYMR